MDARRQKLAAARFYGILDLDYLGAGDPAAMAGAMMRGGVDIVQLRGKGRPTAELVILARRVRPVVAEHGGLLVVNDDPAAAREAGADGVHVGQDDRTVAIARQEAGGGGVLVGKSTHSLEQAVAAEKEGADYIGVGPLYATPTKPDYVPVGLGLPARVKASVRVPSFGIGGVNLETLPAVLAAGAERVVMVSAILKASDPEAYCRRVRELLAGFCTARGEFTETEEKGS